MWCALFAWCMGLPESDEAVPVALDIIPEGDRERWVRHFGARRMVTVVRRLPDGLWRERFGFLEFLLRAREKGNVTYHDSLGCRVVFGPLAIPIPRFLSPTVGGHEEVSSDGVSVEVVVRVPLAGQLLEYSGRIEPVEE